MIIRLFRRLRVLREVQRRLDQILAMDHTINDQTREFRNGAYLALQNLRDWLRDRREPTGNRAAYPSERLRVDMPPGRHVWAFNRYGVPVSGPLVEWLPDGSATVFDNRTCNIYTILPGEVLDADVREE